MHSNLVSPLRALATLQITGAESNTWQQCLSTRQINQKLGVHESVMQPWQLRPITINWNMKLGYLLKKKKVPVVMPTNVLFNKPTHSRNEKYSYILFREQRAGEASVWGFTVTQWGLRCALFSDPHGKQPNSQTCRVHLLLLRHQSSPLNPWNSNAVLIPVNRICGMRW